jgi:predicted DNA-binding protein (UPF0251 family)
MTQFNTNEIQEMRSFISIGLVKLSIDKRQIKYAHMLAHFIDSLTPSDESTTNPMEAIELEIVRLSELRQANEDRLEILYREAFENILNTATTESELEPVKKALETGHYSTTKMFLASSYKVALNRIKGI